MYWLYSSSSQTPVCHGFLFHFQSNLRASIKIHLCYVVRMQIRHVVLIPTKAPFTRQTFTRQTLANSCWQTQIGVCE